MAKKKCSCSREFKTLAGLNIHKARFCSKNKKARAVENAVMGEKVYFLLDDVTTYEQERVIYKLVQDGVLIPN